MRKYGIFGILFLSLCLFGAVHTAYAAEEEESLQITQEELLDEFDFSDLDDSLKKMFPREKMTFRDVVETLVSGDLKKAGEQFTGFLPLLQHTLYVPPQTGTGSKRECRISHIFS